jgi:hypothetical protein
MEGAFDRHMKRSILSAKKQKIESWRVTRMEPVARDELERRIYAATDLIKLNRAEAVDRTLRRFKGWATSVPAGGAEVETRPARASMSKDAQEARYIAKRVAIDQTAKMLANVSDIVATGNGAIGGIWDATNEIRRKHRENHLDWHGLWFAIKGSWADEQGLIEHPNGYISDRFGPPSRPGADDNIVMPARAINCRCELVYAYSLEDVPEDMLTPKGRLALRAAQGRAA